MSPGQFLEAGRARVDDSCSLTAVPRKALEREFRLLKGIAEGTYNTKHAEAAKLYYTTI